MTLNITILTSTTIYQSADFRLTDPLTGKPATDRSAKSIGLTYSTWVGFVTYTGVGGLPNGSDLSDEVAKWLADDKQRSMIEVANHLAECGTKLLNTFGKLYKHTFILAGFENQHAHTFIVSNFEDSYSRVRNSPDAQLKVTSRTLGNSDKATVIVTGCKTAVSPADRGILRLLASKYPTDGGRIRRRMETLNAKAAASPVSRGLISRDCVVLSFRGDGSGVLQLNNTANEIPAQFPHISYGMNTTKIMADALMNLGFDLSQSRLVQGAFASSHSPGRTSLPITTCPFEVKVADEVSTYQIQDITPTEFGFFTLNRINDSGQVVGTGQEKANPQIYIPCLIQNDQLTRLNYPGYAVAINNQGQVAGTMRGEHEQAILYREGFLTEFPLYHDKPGVFAGTDSSAIAIDADGVVVGSVRSSTEEQGRPNKRAALFRREQEPIVFMDLQAEFGSRAVNINTHGQVLVMVEFAPFDVRTIIWTPKSGAWCYVGNSSANVFPFAITDESVLGQIRNTRGDPIAVICHRGGNWERLGTNNDIWAPADINNQGDVIGWAWVDRLKRPWLQLASGKIIWLPYVMEHHTIPTAINNHGQIIGSASADHGQHAVIWQP